MLVLVLSAPLDVPYQVGCVAGLVQLWLRIYLVHRCLSGLDHILQLLLCVNLAVKLEQRPLWLASALHAPFGGVTIILTWLL